MLIIYTNLPGVTPVDPVECRKKAISLTVINSKKRSGLPVASQMLDALQLEYISMSPKMSPVF